MTIQTRTIDYQDGDVDLQGYLAWDDAVEGKRPGVMIAHAWAGRSDFENGKAEKLAKLGYVGFALDNFGKGILGRNTEENSALIQPFLDDRAMLQGRLQIALDVLKGLDEVDASRVAAIGFCFGGLCVLDLARTGTDLAGVVSFHGLFGSPGNTAGNKIKAKVLALHGWDDPMAPPDQVVSLAEELSSMGADWQLHGYGNTMHAFTNPQANDPDFGTVYNPDADRRSWNAMQNFLSEIFA
ncbi:MAG: dienelactone hydrolase family protein [Proteobacteria bacterium]|nr:dienelactone hydrolase family protein [Pseudomonadota bacterium]